MSNPDTREWGLFGPGKKVTGPDLGEHEFVKLVPRSRLTREADRLELAQSTLKRRNKIIERLMAELRDNS